MPKVSIIIPAYNAEKYIEQTLLSIVNQSYSDFECIVIDDGSNDNTVDVVRRFNDDRIKVIEQQNSGGPAKPRNVGLMAASGEYIFIFDSDDIMLPLKLKKYVDIFEGEKDVGVIFSDFQVINEQGEVVLDSFLKEYQSFRKICTPQKNHLFSLDMEKFHAEIIRANFIGTSSVAFKAVENKQLFDERFASGDDILAWVILAKTKRFYFIDCPLHQYRKREGSISSKNGERLLANKIKILAEIEGICSKTSVGKEVTRKKNEYFYNLGYLYRTQGKYPEAMKAYKSIRNLTEIPKVLLALAKVMYFKVRNSEAV